MSQNGIGSSLVMKNAYNDTDNVVVNVSASMALYRCLIARTYLSTNLIRSLKQSISCQNVCLRNILGIRPVHLVIALAHDVLALSILGGIDETGPSLCSEQFGTQTEPEREREREANRC
jgi:hypothetical protein